MIKTYTLSQQGISQLRRRALQRTGTICLLILGVVVVLSILTIDPDSLAATIVPIVLVIGVIAFSLWRGLRQNEEIWRSIQVELGPDYVARSQVRVSQVRLERAEITSIEEIDDGLCLRTADKRHTLAIPKVLDEADYQEIKSQLATWAPIQPQASQARAKGIALGAALLIGLGILAIAPFVWLVLVVGLSMAAYAGYVYWTLRQSEGVDPKFRRSVLIGTLVLLFITATKAYWLAMNGMV